MVLQTLATLERAEGARVALQIWLGAHRHVLPLGVLQRGLLAPLGARFPTIPASAAGAHPFSVVVEVLVVAPDTPGECATTSTSVVERARRGAALVPEIE